MRFRFPGLNGCLLLLTLATAGAGQSQPGPDSLVQELKSHSKKDTLYLETLITLARKTRTQDFSKSESYFSEAISLSRSLKDTPRLVRSLNGAGITAGMQDKYSAAIDYFNQARQVAIQQGLLRDAGVSYGMLGIVYKRLGDYPRSLENYTESLRICERLRDAEGIASNNSNLGVLFDMMKEPDKALEYLHRALSWYRENHSGSHDYGKNIADLHSNIANIHTRGGEYDLAIENYRIALDYYKKHQIGHSLLNTQSNMGWLYYKKGELAKARELLRHSLKQVDDFNLPQQKISILYSLARTTADQGSFRESIALAWEARQLADSIGSLKKRSDAQHLLSYVYEKAGDPLQALAHYKQFSSLQDSLFNEEKTRTYKSQQVIMEVHEKENALKAQITAGNRWKWLLGTTCFCLLLTGLLFYQKSRQRRKYAEHLDAKNRLIIRQKTEIEEINRQLEKRMLRAQMNPHFIFNALNAIQHFITSNDKKASLHYLSLFSSMLRQVLETSVSATMTLKDEIEFLRVYLELEALRFDESFEYHISLDDRLDADMLELPAMVIQPFVENAILHGLMPRNGCRKLLIDIRDGGEHIAVTLTDNGIGREESARLNRKRVGKNPSRGISLSRQRLETLAGQTDRRAGIRYTDLRDPAGLPAGTQVEINIPKQEL